MATKNLLTTLTELVDAEGVNLKATSKLLGASLELTSDIDSLYKTLPPLIKPRGSPDELLALELAHRELMVCRMLLTKGALATLRLYQADAFTDLRRAIESCAFAVRMSKHHDLCTVWAEAGSDKEGESTKYEAYRKAFQPRDVFPNTMHPDYDVLLADLKTKFDICSKRIHGGVFGVASHFGTVPKDKAESGKRQLNYFDMPPDALVPSFFFMVGAHSVILQLFEQALGPYADDLGGWKTEHSYIKGKLQRHKQKWAGHVSAIRANHKQPPSAGT